MTRAFGKLIAEHGLTPVRLHDLRHGAATLALAAGVELKVVPEMLGHSSIVLTADTSTSVLPEVAHTAAEKTAAHILQAGRLVPGRRASCQRVRGRGGRPMPVTLVPVAVSTSRPDSPMAPETLALPVAASDRPPVKTVRVLVDATVRWRL